MAAPLTADVAVPGEVNLAPAKPIMKLQEKNGHKSPYRHHDITAQVREKYQERMKQDEPTWREMILAGQFVGLFIEGKQILDLNPYTNQYTVRKQSRHDPMKIRSVNIMQYFASNWQSKWGSSNPDFILNALSNADQDISRARKANIIVDFLQEDIWDWWYIHHEGLLAQCFGWVGSRIRLCNKTGESVLRPILEDREVTIGQGFGKCYDCGWSGSDAPQSLQAGEATFPMCPQCGSTALVYEAPPTQILQFQAGEKEEKIPRVIAEQLPLPAVRFDQRYRMEDSPWRIFEYDVTEGMLKRLFGKDLRVPEGDTPNTLGLDVANALSQVGSPMGGRSNTGESNKRKNYKNGGVLSEMSLSAEDMHDMRVGKDGETISGVTLPEGACYADLFPQGATFYGANGFALLWGVEPIHHSKSDASTVYHMKVMSGTGRGVQDAAESQKRLNRIDSQILRSMTATGTPATLHLKGAIDPNHRHLLGQPDVDIPVDLSNFPEMRSLKDAVMPMPTGEIRGDLYNYTQQHLQSIMQLQYHITNFTGGLGPRVDNKTATGAEILDENADAVFTPVLGGKADRDRKLLQKAFEKWREIHRGVKSFVPLKAAARSGIRGVEISAEDVEGEYRWRMVPGSEVPRNKLSKRRDRMNFYGLFGGFPNYVTMKKDPQFRSEVAELEREFDMDFAANDYDEIGEMCRTRFEMAKDLLGKTQGLQQAAAEQYGVELPPADPMMILPEVLPSMLVTELDHEVKAEWFARLLDTPEGQRMTSEERALASAFVSGHMILMQGQTLEMGMAQAAIEQAVTQPARDAELQSAAAQGEIDAANQPPPPDEEGAMVREQVGEQASFERQMELEDTQHKHAMQLEKAKAKAAQRKQAA